MQMLHAATVASVAALLALSVTSSYAQAPAANPLVVVRGRVVSAAEGAAAVPRARVTFLLGTRVLDEVLTDDDGAFLAAVPSTPAGVRVSKASFVTTVQRFVAAASGRAVELRLVPGAVVSGQVVDASGRPIVSTKVRVERLAVGEPGATVIQVTETDDQGRFRVGNLPAGRYAVQTLGSPDWPSAMTATSILASAPPEMRATNRQLAESSEQVFTEVRSGEESRVVVSYPRPAVILPYALVGGAVSGTVVDDIGEPVEGLTVQLLLPRFAGPRTVIQPSALRRVTDDRGQFRLFHVPAGRYYVVVTGPAQTETDAAAVYYPGVQAVEGALPIQVSRSEEVSGIDVRYSRVPPPRLDGRLVSQAGLPQRSRLTLTPVERQLLATADPIAWSDEDGFFSFPAVPPGEYVVRASAASESAAVRVSVGEGRQDPVEVRMIPLTRVRGQVRFEDERARPTGLRIATAAASPREDLVAALAYTWSATVAADGTFEVLAPAEPSRLLLTSPPAGWWIKSIATPAARDPLEPVAFGENGGDVTIHVASTAGAVEGRVSDEQSRPVGGYRLLVFSTDPRHWFPRSPYVKMAIESGDRFVVDTLPPGEYGLIALDIDAADAPDEAWTGEELLASLLSSARRVSIGENARQQMDLRLFRMVR